MTKICTDIEQSKKLIELGIDANTADMHYSTWTILGGEFILSVNQGETIEELQEEYGKQVIPAWSLTALLGLIECDYNLEKTLFDQSDLFTYSIVCDDLDFRTYEYDDPIDSAFEMVVWLKENNKI